MPTRKTKRETRFTTGPSSIGSSTPISNAASSRTCRSGSCRKRFPSNRILTSTMDARRYDEIYTGWAYPPKDYAKWAELAYQWVKHCVDQYGTSGSRAVVLGGLERGEYRLLARYARGVQEASRLRDRRCSARTAHRTGRRTRHCGPRRQCMRDFLEHQFRGTNFVTGKTGTPIDFIAFHAKGRPEVRRWPCTHGHLQSALHHRRRFPDRRVVSRTEVEADRHRRIRPRRLCGLSRTAAGTATRPCIPVTRRPASHESTIPRKGTA